MFFYSCPSRASRRPILYEHPRPYSVSERRNIRDVLSRVQDCEYKTRLYGQVGNLSSDPSGAARSAYGAWLAASSQSCSFRRSNILHPLGNAYFPMANFFDLSRELRDMVYSYLTVDQIVLGGGCAMRPTSSIFNAPIPAMLRVNRQLSTEYWESIQKSIILQIVAPKDNIRDQLRLRTLPAFLRLAIRECSIYIRINCWQCTAQEDSGGFEDQTETLCSMRARRYSQASKCFLEQFPNLRRVRIRIGLESHGVSDGEFPRSLHPKQTWVSLLSLPQAHPAVCEVEIMQCECKADFAAYCCRKRVRTLRPLARWERTIGWSAAAARNFQVSK